MVWLHTFSCIAWSEHDAFGTKAQAWRDVLRATRPIHVHSIASCRQILTGCSHLHRSDAGEMLEHWVTVGQQVMAGKWEARIEQRGLTEIRHFAVARMAITLDIPQPTEPTSLQSLVLAWHAQQLGIQAFSDPPKEFTYRHLYKYRFLMGTHCSAHMSDMTSFL